MQRAQCHQKKLLDFIHTLYCNSSKNEICLKLALLFQPIMSENIIGLISEVQSQLEGYDYEIIVVDDNPDGTHTKVSYAKK